MVGLTRYIDKRHICRAALEATAYQTRDVIEAMWLRTRSLCDSRPIFSGCPSCALP